MSKVKIYMPRDINDFEKVLKDIKVKVQVASVIMDYSYGLTFTDKEVRCLLALLSGIEQNKDKVELL